MLRACEQVSAVLHTGSVDFIGAGAPAAALAATLNHDFADVICLRRPELLADLPSAAGSIGIRM